MTLGAIIEHFIDRTEAESLLSFIKELLFDVSSLFCITGT